MRTRGTITTLALLAAFFVLTSMGKARRTTIVPPAKTCTITVIIKNVRSANGRIQLDLYRNQEEYEARKGQYTAYVTKKGLLNGKLKYVYTNVPISSYYGLALFDDENSNGSIDYGWFVPKEGFGFGDYYHTKWSTPHFNDFKFYLTSDKTVTMKVRYL